MYSILIKKYIQTIDGFFFYKIEYLHNLPLCCVGNVGNNIKTKIFLKNFKS